MIQNINIISCAVTVHVQFPCKICALCKKCCCERPEQKNEDDVSSDQGVAGDPSLAVVARESFSPTFTPEVQTPEMPESTTLRISTSSRHSAVFAQRVKANDQEIPSCKLSYLADARYCILDVETSETPGNGVHGVEMSQMTMSSNASVYHDGLVISANYGLECHFTSYDVETPETPENGDHGVEISQMSMPSNATASPDGLVTAANYRLGEDDVAETYFLLENDV